MSDIAWICKCGLDWGTTRIVESLMEGSSKRNEITSASTGVCVCVCAREVRTCVFGVWGGIWERKKREGPVLQIVVRTIWTSSPVLPWTLMRARNTYLTIVTLAGPKSHLSFHVNGRVSREREVGERKENKQKNTTVFVFTRSNRGEELCWEFETNKWFFFFF